jgi:diguanylate cyclase (GGDEF)-like protein
VIACAIRELFAPLIDEVRSGEAATELSVANACAAPIESAGERFGVLVLLSDAAIVPERARLLADHAAAALLNLSKDEAPNQSAADPTRAIFDPRKVEQELQRELARGQRYARDVSICVIEATNLKLLRERFGSELTDRLYDQLGAVLARQARDVDIIGAYKQSGYTMVLTEASASGVESAAERLLSAAASVTLEGERVPGLELHIASGCATSPEDGSGAEALFAAAERRMYGGAAERVA